MVSMATTHLKWLKRTFLTLALIISGYLLAALAGSIFPANQFWKSPAQGVEMFVETNGVHTGLVLPIRNEIFDWSKIVRSGDLSDQSKYGTHIMVGWGHEGVYRNTKVWTDLRVTDAASAIFGSNNVLIHIYHMTYPQPYPYYRRRLVVTEAEYKNIVDSIRSSFLLNPDGSAEPLPGYAGDDVFYRARGNYNAFWTCNNWTSNILRDAGIRVGLWTPFSGGVMRWFPET